LRESQVKYREIVENSNDIILMVQDGNLKFVNTKAVELTGYAQEKILDTPFVELVFPEDRKMVEETYIRQVEGEELLNTHTFRMLKKNGEPFWVEVNGKAVVWGGRPGLLVFMQDISERKWMQDALRESEARFRDIAESMSDWIWEVNRNGVYVYCSVKAEHILGYSRVEVIGKTPFDFMPPDERKRIRSTISDIVKEKRAIRNLENWNLTKDGRLVCLLTNGAPILDENDKLIGYRGVYSDITERKQAERELAETNRQLEKAIEKTNEMAMEADMANQAKSEFLANMSHEIRTPMNAVLGFADMLLDTSLNEEQTDYVGTIRRSGESLLSLINDILDFSKIEAGQLDFEKIDFDPELLAYDVCQLIRPRIESKSIEVLCRIGDNLPSMVRGDPTRYRQVLINLMGNAPKFTESGEIELTLDVDEEEQNRIKLHAKIRDTGIGIPKDKLSAIFEPFKQADGSTTRKYGGTGLGLSICKNISKLMDGDVWAKSPSDCRLTIDDRLLKDNSKNQNNSQLSIVNSQSKQPLNQMPGSVFHFTAWLGKAEKNEIRRYEPVSLSNKKVLIVDDNQNNLDILTHFLESVGMRVVAFTSGEKVVPALQKAFEYGNSFDLCISDIQMPGMDGYDVAKKIRNFKSSIVNRQSSIRSIPLLALSSLMERDAKKCEEAGFDGFLSKPVRREKLYRILEKIIGKEAESKERKAESDVKQIATQYSINEEMKHSVRILLAEDNPVNQKLAKLMLTKGGYHVEVANNGKEAVEKYTQSPDEFDLIFMDIQMPEMDGLEATKEIRKFETCRSVAEIPSGTKEKRENQQLNHSTTQPLNHLPIIAMTANAMKGDREICLEAGMDEYMTKPIKRDLVFEMIKKWVFKE
jgi:two-component system sensor histidine kinase/response regulator